MVMKGITFGVVFFGLLCGLALAHMGITSPTPRDTSDDQKTGPCGNANGEFGGTVTELTPGETFDIVLNSNEHNGLYRVALSQVGEDNYDCVLIDHIPQRRAGAAGSIIPIVVPDVDCSNCALQVYMIVPASTTCCDKAAGECGVAWYACANVKINGKKPRQSLKCKPPCTWAYRDEKPGVYSSVNNDGIWISEGGNNYRLNVTGGYYPPTCQTVTRTECLDDTTTAIDEESAESKTDTSLADGGKMSAGGVIGIIIVLLVLAGIGITWFVAVRNKKEAKPTVPMMGQSDRQQQAVVQVDVAEENNAGTYVRPPMPPPPPQRN